MIIRLFRGPHGLVHKWTYGNPYHDKLKDILQCNFIYRIKCVEKLLLTTVYNAKAAERVMVMEFDTVT